MIGTEESCELQATPELTIGAGEIFRIHKPLTKQIEKAKEEIKERRGVLASIAQKVFGRRFAKSNVIEGMFNSYAKQLSHNTSYENPDDFWKAKKFAESKGLELLTARDFAQIFEKSESDGKGHEVPIITDLKRGIYYEGAHVFPEAAIYHPDNKQIILVRDSPILKNEESFKREVKTIETSREIFGDRQFASIEGKKDYERFLEEGEFFLTKDEYESYLEQGKKEAEKEPEQRQVQILDLLDHPNHNTFYPKSIHKLFGRLEIVNFKYHEATRFLFGRSDYYPELESFSMFLEAKKSAPNVLTSSFEYPSDNAKYAEFGTMGMMNLHYRENKEENFNFYPMANKPFVRQTGFSPYTGDSYCVSIRLNCSLPLENYQVRAIKRKVSD